MSRPGRYGPKQLVREQRYRARNRAIVEACKSQPCMDCGNWYPSICMDYDHVRGVKLFNLGQKSHHSVQSILDEIEKCDVVCSNCHRIRTLERRKNNA